MLRVWLTPDGFQSAHIHPAHSDGKDLDPSLPCLSRYFLHRVLRSPISHYHGDSWDVQVCRSCSMFLSERCLHGVLDGETSHRPCGEVLHVPHCLLHLSLAGVGVEGELGLDHTTILKQTNPSGIRADVQELKQVDDEGLHFLIVVGANASGAVDDKDEIQRDGFAGVLCDQRMEV